MKNNTNTLQNFIVRIAAVYLAFLFHLWHRFELHVSPSGPNRFSSGVRLPVQVFLCFRVSESSCSSSWRHCGCCLRSDPLQFFQKFGFCAILLWKFSYQRRMQLDGMKVSPGFGVIWAWDTAKDEAKL